MSHISKNSLDIAKERIDIPTAWLKLELPGSPSKSCSSPWREDKNPSFSVFDDGRAFKDHATDESGDVLAFVQAATGWDFRESADWLCRQAGIIPSSDNKTYRRPIRRIPVKAPVQPLITIYFPGLHRGSTEEFKAVAASRNIHWEAVQMASQMGCLLFGNICGYDCWVLTDDSRFSAEARRVDGQKFPATGKLGARKVHTLRGSKKSWPVGLGSKELQPTDNILLVEGSSDFLAALHFLLKQRGEAVNSGNGWFPVAMLGRSNSIHPDALKLFNGRCVRIYTHNDSDGGGMAAEQRWAQAIHDAGASSIDSFTFEGITMTDGRPASDLNDCTSCHADSISELTNILPNSNSLT